VLVLDRAGWHTSVRLRVPEHVRLLFLPPSSPEIPPAEHLWPLANSALINRHFASMEELEEAQFAPCAALQLRPDLIRSTTQFHWRPQRVKKRQWPRPRSITRRTRSGAIVSGMGGMRTESPEQAKRPVVTVSYAQTLDGRLATRAGSSRWISGPESLRVAHELRAAHDAVMVGVGTVLADDPLLTVRLTAGRDPLRVVLDSALRTPLQAAVLAGGAARGTVLAVTERAPEERVTAASMLGATVLIVTAGAEGRVDLAALLALLRARGVGSLLVEGGASLITALLRARLADRLLVTVAPKLLGAGIEAVGDLGIAELARAIALRDVRMERYGEDMVLDGRVAYPEAAP